MTAVEVRKTPLDTGTKLPSLTGLRFVAALFVFFYHATLLLGPVPPHGPVTPFADQGLSTDLATALGNGGFIGVSFFFVLSGFVLTWSTRPGEPHSAFLRRRLLKIYPTHVVTWAAAMILFAAAYTPTSAWLSNLLLLHPFSSDPTSFISVNAPSWSLACELLFYVVVFPLLIGPIRRIADSRLWAWAGAMVAGTFAVVLATQYLVPDTPKSPFIPDLSMLQFWAPYYFPPARVFEFVLGMILARIVFAGRWPRIGVLPATGFLLVGYAVSLNVPYLYRFAAATVIPVAVLICAVAAADVRGARTGFGSRAMQWLGERSFGFYMAQGVVLLYGRSLVGDNHQYGVVGGIAVVLGFFAANVLAGWLLYVGVERPIMRRWARRRRPAAA